MPSAIYARVSTAEQNLDRQLDATHEYAESELDVELSEVDVFRDKSTGTDTSRSGYQDMMNAVVAGRVDAVVVKSVSRIARSIRDLDRTAEE